VPLIAQILLPSLSSSCERYYRGLTTRRLAAVALAIRRYRVDHDGQWPATLNALVPSYLPELPADPLASGGAQFGYSANGALPIIYSVGSDGIDQGGSTFPLRKPRWVEVAYNRWNSEDVIVFLTRQPKPQPPPTAEDDVRE
jgi:hypothetical protein